MVVIWTPPTMADTGTISHASISENVHGIVMYICTNFGAFITKWTIGLIYLTMPPHYKNSIAFPDILTNKTRNQISQCFRCSNKYMRFSYCLLFRNKSNVRIYQTPESYYYRRNAEWNHLLCQRFWSQLSHFLPITKLPCSALPVFIDWLNLDVGIKTCFIDGLTENVAAALVAIQYKMKTFSTFHMHTSLCS